MKRIVLSLLLLNVLAFGGEGVVKDRRGHEWKVRASRTQRIGSEVNIAAAKGGHVFTVRSTDRQTKINELAAKIDEARRAKGPVKIGSATLSIDEAEGLRELLGRLDDVVRTLPASN